jgi:hypothetical protein
MNKQTPKILMISIATGIVAALIFGYLAGFLYDAFSSPITMTYETKRSKGVPKENERSTRMQSAARLAGGTMAGLLGLFATYSYLTAKQKRERFEKDSGWA